MSVCDTRTTIVILNKDQPFISRLNYKDTDNAFVIDGLEGHPRDSIKMVTESVFAKIPMPGDMKYKLMKQLPRPSTTQEGMVAYYETEEKKNIQRLSVIKPGRYLRKYLVKDDGNQFLNDVDIEKYANLWLSEYCSRKLYFLTRSEDIVAAYTESGINSCMSYQTHHFASDPYHPVSVYGTEDGDDTEVDTALAVIYADEDDKSPSNIIARCVVWPEKKVKSNTYGDYHKLNNLLSCEGYETGSFEGARMRRIESPSGTVCPYFDFSCGAEVSGKNIIASPLASGGENQNGLLVSETCCCCNEPVDPQYSRLDDDGNIYCETCFDEEFFYCDVTDSYERIEYSTNVRSSYGMETVSEIGLDMLIGNGEAFFCSYEHNYYLSSDYEYVIDVDGDTYEFNNFYHKMGGFQCAFSEEFYTEKYGSLELEDGVVVCEEAFENSKDEYIKWLCDNDYKDERFLEEIDAYLGQGRLELEKEGELL